MCGIWASVGFEADQRVLAPVAHRGPDGEGLRRFETGAGPLVLAHRRLSIYDPTPAGAQPMSYADDRYVVVLNGAMYNYQELRTELEAKGASFASESDTEVLLAAYREWGAACLARLNGMFAFILWDQQQKTLTISRDRFGEKPLHYARVHGGWAFGSEIAQLLAVSSDLRAVEIDRVGDFLNFGVVDSGQATFFKSIRRFPPGHYAVLEMADAACLAREFKFERFWTAPAIDEALRRPETAAEALAPVLRRSIALRLTADVPVGTCLSGGLDSTFIARAADRIRDGSDPFVCVSAVFDEDDPGGNSISERPFVEAALEGGHFAPHVISPDGAEVADAFDDIVRHQGEPFASASICAQYFVFQEARRSGVKVMLDGQGADEMFGGYAGMVGPRLADLALGGEWARWWKEWNALGAPGGDLSRTDLFRATYSAALPEAGRRRLAALRGRWPPANLLAPTIAPPPPARDGVGRRFDAVVRRLVGEASLPALLRYEDRNAMAHGIESRLPFLDVDVADLALRMPGSAKIAGGETKRVLRLAAADVTPDLILRRRRKLGFVAPQDRWMAGALKGLVLDAMGTARRKWDGLIDQVALTSLEEMMVTDPQAGARAFRVLSFVRWAELHRVSV